VITKFCARFVRSTRKLTRLRWGYGGLRQSARSFPSAPPMLGAGQRENQKPKTVSKLPSRRGWGLQLCWRRVVVKGG